MHHMLLLLFFSSHVICCSSLSSSWKWVQFPFTRRSNEVAVKPINATVYRFPISIASSMVYGAGVVGCTSYLCATALTRAHERQMSDRLNSLSLDIKRLKLDQQYLEYSINDVNNSHHKKLSLFQKKLKTYNDTISNYTQLNDNKFLNASKEMAIIAEELVRINDYKLVKLQRLFEEDLGKVLNSLQSIEKRIPFKINQTEEKLLRQVMKQGKFKKIMKS